VLTDYGIRTTKVDVSRRERGVRHLTVDQLFLYAIALNCGIADLLVGDDGWTWITPLTDADLKRGGRRKFRDQAQAIALRPGEMRQWLRTGRWPGFFPARRPVRAAKSRPGSRPPTNAPKRQSSGALSETT
jgi:hypothetical protein